MRKIAEQPQIIDQRLRGHFQAFLPGAEKYNYCQKNILLTLFYRYQEFIFTLPPDNMYVQGQGITKIESLQLRIAVQGEGGGQIVAMSTMEYDELKISVR